MSDSSSEPWDWYLDMQLTGKLVFSAAALLLGALVYRLYKYWPARDPPRAGTSTADATATEEPEVAEQGDPSSTSARARLPGLRWRGQVSREEGAKGNRALGNDQPEGAGGACDLKARGRLDLGDGHPVENKRAGFNKGEQHPGKSPVWDCLGEKATGQGKNCDSELESPQPGLDGNETDCPSDSWQEPGLLLDCIKGQRKEEEISDSGSEKAATGWEDMNRSWVFTQAAGVSQDGLGIIRATSDMGLAVSQHSGEANTSYVFSSLARAQIEENFLGKQTLEERTERPWEASASPGLKGKIYDYYVESTSRSISRDMLALRASTPRIPGGITVPQGSPLLLSFERFPAQPHGRFPDPLTSPGCTHPSDRAKDVCESASSSRSPPSLPGTGISRKESFLQIAENPEFQLQLDNMGTSPSSDIQLALHSSIESPDLNAATASLEPKVELVAGTNFFQLPLVPGAAQNTHLDLGNCYEVLKLAKREKLDVLKKAAYKVMSDNYLQVLQSPDIYGRLSGAERELILQRRLQGQKYLVVADVCPQEGTGRLCAYNNEQDAWWPLASLPPEATSRGCAICSLFNYLFVVAGCQRVGGQASNRMFCYNPLTGIWREMCPLNQARPHCKLVVLDGYMYAIGGECLYTVERYNPRQDRWTFVAPLPNDTFALAHTATACDGEIYVTGGTLRYLLLRYSGQEDRWRASPAAGGKDRTAEMASVNGFLYRFDLNRSLGIGVYRCSARTRLWYECATYRVHYPAAFQCAAVDNLIHCVGRQFHLRFLADYVSPRFLSNELQGFPSPQGTLIPTVLVLPALNMAQTRV
ncbi:kelch domain-containing protein 7A [Phascolarctos cinereus]|uniref:Kelch domain-containing protein 7A n=1 Tax=Phascolarctos cinereus TaxID=38626 RepID=A0A6P5JCN9_PHACI|nr:kelch domain-containing protein 7A [Phascolarctos cinereus]